MYTVLFTNRHFIFLEVLRDILSILSPTVYERNIKPMHHLFQAYVDNYYYWRRYRKNPRRSICRIKAEDNNLEMEFERFVSEQEVALFGAPIKFSMNFFFF